MKRKSLILVTAVLLIVAIWPYLKGFAEPSVSSSQTSELPDFDHWTVQYFVQEDFDKNDVYDAALVIVREKTDPAISSSLAYLYSFHPVNLERIDLVIWLQYARTAEPGKNTIISVRFLFYARENDKLVLVEEGVSKRPSEVKEPAVELMFEENSRFGRRYFEEWRKLGFSDDRIRQAVPKWIWLPEVIVSE